MKNINYYLLTTIFFLSVISFISIKSCSKEKTKFSDYIKTEKVINDKSSLIDSVLIAQEYSKQFVCMKRYDSILTLVKGIKKSRLIIDKRLVHDSIYLADNNIHL